VNPLILALGAERIEGISDVSAELERTMHYKVVLSKNEDGYSVHCPALRGCWSQGATEQEALQNIRSAIEEYLAAVDELAAGDEIREVEVTVG
jgi:predicted RNase H-like HicB family nuclease